MFPLFSVAWCDIGGYEDVKRALREMIEVPLTRPQLLAKFRAAPARGALLYGPPGKCSLACLQAIDNVTFNANCCAGPAATWADAEVHGRCTLSTNSDWCCGGAS